MKKVSLYPADVYQVIDKSLLSETDKLILNMLYMPIIGSIAIALYLKMQNETRNTFISPELTHHHLMTSMGTTLDNIKEARLKLEGIGLLKTYYHEGEVNSYVYELYSPLIILVYPFRGGGSGLRSHDLQIMSLTSYLTALSCDIKTF